MVSHCWFYIDAHATAHGPFTYDDMLLWSREGYFDAWTPAALSTPALGVPSYSAFRPLGQLIGCEVFLKEPANDAGPASYREQGIVDLWFEDRHFGFIVRPFEDAANLFVHQDCIHPLEKLYAGEQAAVHEYRQQSH